VTSRSSPPPPLPGWNGWPSPTIHWVSTQGPPSIWPHPRCRLLQSHQIHQRAHPASKRTPSVGLTWERYQFSRDLSQGHTPSQTQYQTHNYRTASLSCKVWFLSCDKAWTTFSFDWKSWTTKASALLQILSTLQGVFHSTPEQAKLQRKHTEVTQGMAEHMLQGLATAGLGHAHGHGRGRHTCRRRSAWRRR
jgi:hypothetical protein